MKFFIYYLHLKNYFKKSKWLQVYVDESLLLYDTIAKKCCNKNATENEEILYKSRQQNDLCMGKSLSAGMLKFYFYYNIT